MALLRRLAFQARRIILMTVLGGLLAATMVRLSPGFGADEQDVSAELSEQTRAALKAQRLADGNVVRFYARYLAGLPRGEFGFSRSLNRPVSALLKDRLPETVASVSWGMGGGLTLGFGLALVTVFLQRRTADITVGVSSGFMLSIPAAVLALTFLWTGANPKGAIALLVFPHVYRYAKNVLVECAGSPYVLAARARGIPAVRILISHIVRPAAPQLVAAAGISATLAFGASIPVEAICDTPGIGQLVWKAALGRDLPLLVTITVLVALMTMTMNAAADVVIAACSAPQAAGGHSDPSW